MKKLRRMGLLLPAMILVIAGIGWYLTQGAINQSANLRRRQGLESGIVDQRSWQTAATLEPLAVTVEEQGLPRTRNALPTMR